MLRSAGNDDASLCIYMRERERESGSSGQSRAARLDADLQAAFDRVNNSCDRWAMFVLAESLSLSLSPHFHKLHSPWLYLLENFALRFNLFTSDFVNETPQTK